MNHMNVCVTTDAGKPLVTVPHDSVWSLVEYLAFRRVQAEFKFEDNGFVALFPHLSAAAAQQVIDDWAAYELALAEQTGGSSAARHSHEMLHA